MKNSKYLSNPLKMIQLFEINKVKKLIHFLAHSKHTMKSIYMKQMTRDVEGEMGSVQIMGNIQCDTKDLTFYRWIFILDK